MGDALNDSVELDEMMTGNMDAMVDMPADGTGSNPADAAPNAQATEPKTSRDLFLDRVEAALVGDYTLDRRSMARIYQGDQAICAPIIVTARYRDTSGCGWSIGIQFLDYDGQEQQALLSLADIAGARGRWINTLTDRGFAVYCPRAQFVAFLQSFPADKRGLLLEGPGWFELHDGQSGYAFSDGTTTICGAEADPRPVLRSPAAQESLGGDLEGWKTQVAALAMGNPLMIFAISAALTGPLLHILGLSSFGVNFFGPTSSGKTTLLSVAAALRGAPDTFSSWDATATALELMLRQARDGTVILDEAPTVIPADFHNVIMSFGNGTSKARSGPGLTLMAPPVGRSVLLSSSERPIMDALRSGRRPVPEGAAVRVIDVPVRAFTHLAFENLHGETSAQAFLARLDEAMTRNHGMAFRAFVQHLCVMTSTKQDTIALNYEKIHSKVLSDLDMTGASSREQRVLRSFSAVALAGALACRFGIVPWDSSDVRSAAVKVAQLWRDYTNSVATAPVVAALRRLMERLDDFDLMNMLSEDDLSLPGWRDMDWLYLKPEFLTEIAAGIQSPTELAQSFEHAGILRRGKEATSLQERITVRGIGRRRVYRLNFDAILDALDEEVC